MGRRTYTVRPVDQLKSLSRHSLDLCDTCVGCELREELAELETKMWQKHRMGGKFLRVRCNSYKTDPEKAKIAPPLGDGSDA